MNVLRVCKIRQLHILLDIWRPWIIYERGWSAQRRRHRLHWVSCLWWIPSIQCLEYTDSHTNYNQLANFFFQLERWLGPCSSTSYKCPWRFSLYPAQTKVHVRILFWDYKSFRLGNVQVYLLITYHAISTYIWRLQTKNKIGVLWFKSPG